MQGKIVTWNDDRGFGFIAPDDGSAQLFFHISAVRTSVRRPQQGDRVAFETTRDRSGRLKAAWVTLENAAAQPQAPRRAPSGSAPRGRPAQTRPFRLLGGAALLVLLFLGWLLTQGPLSGLFTPTPAGPGSALQVEAPIQREIDKTLALIRRGGPYPHSQDGTVFQNRERRLPAQARGYYREYTVRTPGLSHRGPRRIVTGGNPPVIYYYTEDHYQSFRVLEPRP